MPVSWSSKVFLTDFQKDLTTLELGKEKGVLPDLQLTSPLHCLLSAMFLKNGTIVWEIL